MKLKLMKKIFDLFEFFEIDSYYEAQTMIVSRCPVHEGDNQTAFNINTDEENEDHYGKWFCNTKNCHTNKPGKDILSLVWMLLEKKFGKTFSFPEVLDFCNKFCSDVSVDVNKASTAHNNNPIDKLLKLDSKKPSSSNNTNITSEVVRRHLVFPAQYYINRGFSQEVLDAFDIGVCLKPESQMYKRVVFPVYDHNDKYMVGCVGRTICDDPRKWINQKGFNKSNHLYNYGKAIKHIKRADAIILVEGQGDVIRLNEAGIHNAVGMFGSKISDSQEFLIQRTSASNVVIMADNDHAGHECTKDLISRLKYLFNIYTVELTKNDIGDMTVDEINNFLKPQIQGKF